VGIILEMAVTAASGVKCQKRGKRVLLLSPDFIHLIHGFLHRNAGCSQKRQWIHMLRARFNEDPKNGQVIPEEDSYPAALWVLIFASMEPFSGARSRSL